MTTPSVTHSRPSGARRAGRLTAAAVLAAAIALLVPASASAHGGGETDVAFDLVRQAIALIVNTPGNEDAIADKINDAIDSTMTDNVNESLVHQAKDAMEAGDMHQVRRLLEQSIGARVHTGAADPVPIGQPAAVGADTGTVAAVDGIPGRHGLAAGDWIVLAISVLAVAGALAVALRRRPHPAKPPTQRGEPR